METVLLTLLIIYLLNFTYSLLEQVDTFLYLGSLITEDGECTTEFRTRLNRSLQKIWKSHGISISRKIRLMKALVWPVATYCCESWTLKRMKKHAFEMKGLKKICGFFGLQRKQMSGFLTKLE